MNGPTVPHDLRLIDVKTHTFAVGMVTLTCPCGWSDTISRLDCPGVRAAHAAACIHCRVDDPDTEIVNALAQAVGVHRGSARAALRILRSDGFEITRKDPQ